MSKTALRTTKITIDNAKIGGDNWISAEVQEIELNEAGQVIAERVASRQIYRKVAGPFVLEPHTFVDPMTGHHMTLNVAQIASAIRQTIIDWQVEDFGAVHEDGWVVLP